MITHVIESVTQVSTHMANSRWAVLITLTLMGLLVLRELISGLKNKTAHRIVESLIFPIIPLLVFFLAIVIVRITSILGQG